MGEQIRIEQERQMEELRLIEEQKKMEEQRLIAEQRQLEELKILEEQKKMEEQQMIEQQRLESFNQIYESAEVGAGLKGYKRKDEIDGDLQVNGQQSGMPKMVQNNGIFGGITGDQNSLLEDDQFDCKKHSVRDLVGHFSKVKPKAQIPVQYLPEQKIYNGDQGPSLNYQIDHL